MSWKAKWIRDKDGYTSIVFHVAYQDCEYCKKYGPLRLFVIDVLWGRTHGKAWQKDLRGKSLRDAMDHEFARVHRRHDNEYLANLNRISNYDPDTVVWRWRGPYRRKKKSALYS
jgi:hypothetical protein